MIKRPKSHIVCVLLELHHLHIVECKNRFLWPKVTHENVLSYCSSLKERKCWFHTLASSGLALCSALRRVDGNSSLVNCNVLNGLVANVILQKNASFQICDHVISPTFLIFYCPILIQYNPLIIGSMRPWPVRSMGLDVTESNTFLKPNWSDSDMIFVTSSTSSASVKYFWIWR